MHLIERIATVFTERRTEERHSVLLTAELHSDAGIDRGVLLNISISGAMMASIAPHAIGLSGVLHFAGRRAEAEVVWCQGHRFGLRFARPLGHAAVDEIAARFDHLTRAR